MRKRYIATLLTALSLLFFPVTVSAQSTWTSWFGRGLGYDSQSVSGDRYGRSTLDVCAHGNRHYEVCTAYIANASLAARYPFYQFGSSGNTARRLAATNRLESRYTGQARAELESQVADWPPNVSARIPNISIRMVTVSSDENSATLVTREGWRVTSSSGAVLFVETDQEHTVHMARVPGLVLHKWVVTDIE